ncbi:endogenous retroviral envelope protein HEMO [Symphalangus syndactylus]|uniref:endogenous retroviral envelope protein HEMO n=1 Tax=Symphalangus syndactylus TaxID=9590 RepID=UPI0024434A0F|nr:endogenous retroviral envelope protein HEMO [Symphalangus syndactylus]
MGSLSNYALLQLTLTAFLTILVQPQHLLAPVFRTLSILTNQSNCWLCEHLDNAEQPELVFVPASASTWWTYSGQWVYERVWYPQAEVQNHSTSSYDKVTRHWEASMEAQGLSFAQVRLLEGNFSLCIENKNGTGPFLGNIPEQYCNQILWFDSTDGTFMPSIDVTNESRNDYDDTSVCLGTRQCSWLSGCTNRTWNSSAVPFIDLPNTQDYKWVDRNSGLTWSGNDTCLYSCQNQTKGLLYQLFRNLFCSYGLTEAHGKWRCADVNITNDKGYDGHQTPTWWLTGSNLTLSVNNSGLFFLCGNGVYKGFPPKWSGRCGLGYLVPSLTRYLTLNASQITNLRSFIHKVTPHRCTQRDTDNPPLYCNPKHNSTIRALFPSLGTYDLEKAILNISKAMEQEFSATKQTLEAHQSKVSSLASASRKDHVLDIPTTQRQTACGTVGKQCCLYINHSEEIMSNIQRLREASENLKNLPLLDWEGIFAKVGDWFRSWGYVLLIVLFCLFIFVLIYIRVFRKSRRSLNSQPLNPALSPQQSAQQLVSETSCQVSNRAMKGLTTHQYDTSLL